MRILQVASGDFFSTYGGGQVYVRNIVDRMIDMDLDLSIISFVRNCGTNENLYRGHRIESVSPDISESDLESIVCDINPDIIHTHSNEAIVCAVGKKLGIPVLVTSHHGGILCPAGALMDCRDSICRKTVTHRNCLPCVLRNIRTGLGLWYPFMRHLPARKYISLGKRLESLPFIPFVTPVGQAALQIDGMKRFWQCVANDSTLVIAPSQRIADAMIANGLDKGKVKVLPHGIPLPSSKQPQPEIVDGKIKFFFVGRICYIKGLHVLLDALGEVADSRIEMHIIGGAGNKEEERYLSRLRRKYDHDSRIFWHGKVNPSEIYDLTRQFHISVAPTVCMEIFGLNIAEALALGKPVLASRCGGAEMQIRDGVNGWLVEPNDHKALAEKINGIIMNPKVINSMSRNCGTISIEEHCNSLVDIYSNVLK
ncbi:MAG: glycosyltransferase [Muribaculaceae bacterium]|nr:glycosyltransferase [Muribaculaceae bacterium]